MILRCGVFFSNNIQSAFLQASQRACWTRFVRNKMWTSAIRLAQSGADPEQFGENTAVTSQSLNLAKCQECLNMICGKLWHWKSFFFFFNTSKYAQLLAVWPVITFTHLFSSASLGPGHRCQQPKHTSPDLPLHSHLLFEGSIPRPAKRHTKAW